MVTPHKLAGLLLLTSALYAPATLAQSGSSQGTAPSTPTPADVPTNETPQSAQPEAAEDVPEVSIPGGGDIIVTGRRNANIEKSAPAVITVLSAADIARTGEGDIAGALQRVTGLSVVGNGFVYVRGLGDRYSLALLNGSPLPSPEPLKRVVPLDLFPTNVVASSLVQKSYSVNYPGEFGGGVINLTTKAVPKEDFLTIGGGIGANPETTGSLGYTYYGGKSDWTGFDNGSRNTPPALASFFKSGARVGDLGIDQAEIIGQFATPRNAVIQRNIDIPVNWSASVSAGGSKDVGDVTLGLIATAGYSNKWRTRDITQQTSASLDLGELGRDFHRVTTDNRIVVNGLLGLGAEFGDNRIRWTNLYIRDTLKQARYGAGRIAASGNFDFLEQDTAWYERQLIDTQIVGEFKFGPVSLNLRGGYANSQREAPYELFFQYVRTNIDTSVDPLGDRYINRLNGNVGTATVAFSDLNEDLWSGGIDASMEIVPDITATIGYAYQNTKRRSDRREFRIQAPSDMPEGIGLLRPDILLSGPIADHFKYQLFENTESDPAFAARLRNHAGYGQIQATLMDGLSLNVGVRYEKATQTVNPIQVFSVPTNSGASTALKRDYWLPAATLTWELGDNMQVRANASKTIARPQFRELIFQTYYDPETNVVFQGNPLLTDSELINAELRYEWYFAREQRLSVAGFFKKIDNPIEAFVSPAGDNGFTTSFANAPSARLYGAEFEAQKYFPLDSIFHSDALASRRLVTIANYTYTKSKLKVRSGDMVAIYGVTAQPASNYFRDGSAMTGQSDHLVNLQIGLEDTDKLSQQTLLLNYASKRVTRRGLTGQPDIVEQPGFTLDFVARQGIRIGGIETEFKFEARNLTGTKYREYQDNGVNRVYYNLYKLGTSVEASLSINF